MYKIALILLISTQIACKQTQEIPFGHYKLASANGYFNTKLHLKADSTFIYQFRDCLSNDSIVGNFTKRQGRLYFYNLENLRKQAIIDSAIVIDTQYVYVKKNISRIIYPPIKVYQYGLKDAFWTVPSSIKRKNNRLFMFNNVNKKMGSLTLFKKD